MTQSEARYIIYTERFTAADMHTAAEIEEAHRVIKAINARAARRRRERDQVYKGLGMQKVKGAMGGTYYE